MKTNVGGIDRVIRILAGIVLIALAATGTVGWWGWLGVVPLATGALGWCPPYSLLGINTCSVKNAPKA
jgi:membrane protein implicated in regulation of membrane protease activity